MICTVLCGGDGPKFPNGEFVYAFDNRENKYMPCQAYQKLFEMWGLGKNAMGAKAPFICYCHDDIEVFDLNWFERVSEQMTNEDTVCIGFGGAAGLGNKDLYRKPYKLENMARIGYASNQRDAETHGERFTGYRRVAVVDAFFMAIKTSFLEMIGGWPVEHLTFHCLDLFIACEAARHDKTVGFVGVDCVHHGGRSSTKDSYRDAPWLLGGSRETDHRNPHAWLWDSYRDCLPIEVAR